MLSWTSYVIGTGTRWCPQVAVSALFLTSQGTEFKNGVFFGMHCKNVWLLKCCCRQKRRALTFLLIAIEALIAVRRLGSEPCNTRRQHTLIQSRCRESAKSGPESFLFLCNKSELQFSHQCWQPSQKGPTCLRDSALSFQRQRNAQSFACN